MSEIAVYIGIDRIITKKDLCKELKDRGIVIEDLEIKLESDGNIGKVFVKREWYYYTLSTHFLTFTTKINETVYKLDYIKQREIHIDYLEITLCPQQNRTVIEFRETHEDRDWDNHLSGEQPRLIENLDELTWDDFAEFMNEWRAEEYQNEFWTFYSEEQPAKALLLLESRGIDYAEVNEVAVYILSELEDHISPLTPEALLLYPEGNLYDIIHRRSYAKIEDYLDAPENANQHLFKNYLENLHEIKPTEKYSQELGYYKTNEDSDSV